MESFTNAMDTFFSKARRDLNKLNQITDENTFRAQPTSKPTSLSICAKVIRASRLEHPTQSTPFAPHPSPRPTPIRSQTDFQQRFIRAPEFPCSFHFQFVSTLPTESNESLPPCRNVFNPCSKPPTYPCPRIRMIL